MNREYPKEPLPHKTSVAEDILYLDAETEKELFKARWMVNFIWHRHRRNVTRNFYHQRNTRNILQLLNNHQTVFVMVSHAQYVNFTIWYWRADQDYWYTFEGCFFTAFVNWRKVCPASWWFASQSSSFGFGIGLNLEESEKKTKQKIKWTSNTTIKSTVLPRNRSAQWVIFSWIVETPFWLGTLVWRGGNRWGPCTMRSNASWVMVTWDRPLNRMTDRQNWKHYLTTTSLASSKKIGATVKGKEWSNGKIVFSDILRYRISVVRSFLW